MLAVKPHPFLLVVWWLWLLPALMVLLLPLKWWFALLVRGRDSALSSGIDGGGFAILGVSAVPFLLGVFPFVLLSLLYGFLFWRHRERGIVLSGRFWVPIYGAAFIVLVGGIMALVTLSREQSSYRTSQQLEVAPRIRALAHAIASAFDLDDEAQLGALRPLQHRLARPIM